MHVKHGKPLHSQSSLGCWSHSLQIDRSLTRHMQAYHTRQDLSVSCKALPMIRQCNITLRHHVQFSNLSDRDRLRLECFQAAEIHGEEIDMTPTQGTGSDSAPLIRSLSRFMFKQRAGVECCRFIGQESSKDRHPGESESRFAIRGTFGNE
jgi:hypothetical protein